MRSKMRLTLLATLLFFSENHFYSLTERFHFSFVGAQKISEYQIKAAFIYNFTKFVNWPSEAFNDANAAFVIGVLGEDPFGNHLDQAFVGKYANGHPITVKRLKANMSLRSCHVLFISSSERRRLPQIFESIQGKAILTIGESDQFIQQGGMISFDMEDDKIDFEISSANAEKAGLKISAKLLALAKGTRLYQR